MANENTYNIHTIIVLIFMSYNVNIRFVKILHIYLDEMWVSNKLYITCSSSLFVFFFNFVLFFVDTVLIILGDFSTYQPVLGYLRLNFVWDTQWVSISLLSSSSD